MGSKALAPIGSRWEALSDNRVFVVVERKPFGRLCVQEEGRPSFGAYTHQRMFVKFHTRLPDKAESGAGASTNGTGKEKPS